MRKSTLLFRSVLSLLGCAALVQAACPPGKAAQLLKQGLHEKALAALKGCPADPATHKARGIAFHGLYQPDSAIHSLRLAHEGGLKDDEVLLPLAEALLWKKDFRAASEVADAVKAKEGAGYLKVMARKHEILGELDQAVAHYDKAIALEKLPYGTLERKAMVLSWMKKFDESIAIYDGILKEKVVSQGLKVRCLIRKAEVMSWKNEFDPALAELDKALAKDRKNLEARLVKGRILEWKGEYKPAKALYAEILALAPDNEQAKLRLEKLSWVQ
jgi:tetratricopeptide (TPR) repeat protein